MEKDNTLSLRRHRSLQSVLSSGLRLYGQNLWRLVRSSWLQAIAYALALGFTMTWFFCQLLPRLLSGMSSLTESIVWGATVLLFIACAVLLAFAGGVSPLHEHARTDSISMPRRWWGRWPWKLMARGVVQLPRMLWTAVRRGQLGPLVALALVMALLVLVLTLLLEMPMLILGVANIQAQMGLANGDAVDIPSHLWLINMATFSACGFLQAYLHLATLFPLYYLWGNVLVSTDRRVDSK